MTHAADFAVDGELDAAFSAADASVRAQLERAQTQNRDLEAMMRRQAANTEKLQGLVEASTPGPS